MPCIISQMNFHCILLKIKRIYINGIKRYYTPEGFQIGEYFVNYVSSKNYEVSNNPNGYTVIFRDSQKKIISKWDLIYVSPSKKIEF